jgi:hypothetical protein
VSCSDRGRERKETFHSILQEFPEVSSFRTIHEGSAIPVDRKWREHKGVQEQSLSPMVSLHVDFSQTQKATEICEKI